LPWTPDEFKKKHAKDLSPKQAEVASAVANRVLDKCKKEGGSDCEGKAIRQGIAAGKRVSDESADILKDFPDIAMEEDIYDNFFMVEDVGIGRVTEEAILSFPGRELISISEENKTQKTMIVTFISSGWSKNNNYWSPEIIEDMVARINNGEAKTQYLNHITPPRIARGRQMEEKVSTALEAWVERKNGITYGVAKVMILPTPAGPWVYETAKIAPWEVGASIDVWGKARKGKIDGGEGLIWEQIGIMFSFDYVDRPGTNAGVNKTEDLKMGTTEKINLVSFSDFLTITTNRNKLADLFSKFQDYIWDICHIDTGEDSEKKAKIEEAISILGKELNKIDYLKAFGPNGDQIYIEEAIKIFGKDFVQSREVAFSDIPWTKIDKTKLPASSFLIVGDKDKKDTWHLPYKDASGKVNRNALCALSAIIETEQFKGKNLDFTIPALVKLKVKRLLKQAGISESKNGKEMGKILGGYLVGWLPDVPNLK